MYRRLLVHISLFIISAMLATTSLAQDCEWVRVRGVASLENVTKNEARRLAIDDGRRAAVEKVVGVDVLAETMVINYNVSGDVIRTVPYGKVVGMEIIKEEVQFTPSNEKGRAPYLAYKVDMKVQVAKEKGTIDSFFRLDAKINRSVFKEGDDIEIKITPTKDCYITIFNILKDERVLILIPNRFRKNNFVKANDTFTFPDKNDHRKGIQLTACLGAGQKKTDEIFHVLALKEPLKFDTARFSEGVFGVYKGNSGLMCDLVKDIVGIPLSQRAEKFIHYRITK